MKRLIALFSIIFMAITFISCATVKTEVKDTTGRLLPNPHYYAQPIAFPIAIIFYYTAYEEVQDVDGTILYKPTFLSFLESHEIDNKKYKNITLTIEVNNPNRIEYSLYENANVDFIDSEDTLVANSGGVVNSSSSDYRQFVYQLPNGDNVKEVDYTMIMQIGDREVLRVGPFIYSIINDRKGGFENEK
jgi:hypothetical protein